MSRATMRRATMRRATMRRVTTWRAGALRGGALRGGALRWAAFALVPAALVAAACGVPTGDHPNPVPASNLPPAWNGHVTTPTTTLTPAGPSMVQATLYYEAGGTLYRATAELPAPFGAQELVDTLGGPPPPASIGLASATAPAGALTVSAPGAGDTVTVGVTATFTALTGEAQELCAGAIVLTLTDAGVAARVLFEQDGRSVPVPTATGFPTAMPVGATDYVSLVG